MSNPQLSSIALDASLWDEPTTGIGLYARCLAGALEREGVRIRLLGARRSGEEPRGSIGRSAYVLGRLPAALERTEAPLYHGLGNFNLPLQRVQGTQTVLTVHDVIPDLLPDTASFSFRWQFRLWLTRSLHVADRIICISERTRADLIQRYPVDASKISVIPLGLDHIDSVPPPDTEAEAFLRSLVLPEHFVLYAGSLDARKNVNLVLDAVERLKAQGRPATLVLLGQSWFGSGPVERRIGALRAQGHDIRPLGYQTDSVYYALMRRASVFVFPSRYEGFGLPPLEAMKLGVPTLIARAGALPEVCGDAAIQLPTDAPDAWAAQIHRLLSSPEERAKRAAAGVAQAAAYTWKQTARKTLDVYRAALAEVRN